MSGSEILFLVYLRISDWWLGFTGERFVGGKGRIYGDEIYALVVQGA